MKRNLLVFFIAILHLSFYAKAQDWQRLYPFYGTSAIEDDFVGDARGDLWLVGTYAGIYKTMDKGNTWTYVSLGSQKANDVNDLLITSNYIFAVTDDGIYRSADEGNSWERIMNGISEESDYYYSSKLFLNNATLYFFKQKQLYKSTDNGATWALTNIATNNITQAGDRLFYSVYDSNTGESKLYFTTNGTNQILYNSNFADGTTTTPYEIFGSSQKVFFVKDRRYVYYSDVVQNGNVIGTNWTMTAGQVPEGYEIEDVYYKGNTLYLMAYSTDEEGTGALFYSSDNGESFQSHTLDGLPGNYLEGFFFIGSDFLASADVLGVYVFNPATAKWEEKENGFDYQTGYLFTSGENLLYSAYGNGLYRSTNKGLSWSRVEGVDFELGPIEFYNVEDEPLVAGSNIYLVPDYPKDRLQPTIYRSIDNGLNFEEITLPASATEVSDVNLEGGKGNVLFISYNFGFGGAFYRSKDRGNTWEAMSSYASDITSDGEKLIGIQHNWQTDVYKVVASSNDGDTWFDYSDGITFGYYRPNGFYRTNEAFYLFLWNYETSDKVIYRRSLTDAAWSKLEANGLHPDFHVEDLSYFNERLYLADYQYGIYVSSDLGANWTQYTAGPPVEAEVYGFASLGDRLYAYTYGFGIFTSSAFISPTLANVLDATIETGSSYSRQLAVSSGDVAYYKLVNGQGTVSVEGLYEYTNAQEGINTVTVRAYGVNNTFDERSFTITVTDNVVNGIEEDDLLKSVLVYPVPASDKVNIKIDTKKARVVQVKVYNTAGKEITSLNNKQLSSGTYNFEWNVDSKEAAGIYFIKIKTEESSIVKRVIIQK